MPVNFAPGWQAPPSTIGNALWGLSKALDTFAAYKNEERDYKMRLDEVARRNAESEQMRKVRDLEIQRYQKDLEDKARLEQEQEAQQRGALATPGGETKIGEMPITTMTGGPLSQLIAGATQPAAPPPIDLGPQFTPPAAPPVTPPVQPGPLATMLAPGVVAGAASATATAPPVAGAPPAPPPVAAKPPVQPAPAPLKITQTHMNVMGTVPTGPLSAEQRVQAKDILAKRAEQEAEAKQEAKDVSAGRLVPKTPELMAALQKVDPTGVTAALYKDAKYIPSSLADNIMAMAKPPAPAKAPETKEINGRLKGWNPATQRFDIDYGVAGKGAGAAGLNPGEFEALVQGYLAGNLGPTDLGKSALRAQITSEAQKRDPRYTPARYLARVRMRNDYASSATGSAGAQMDSLNQLADHMTQLQEAAKALENHDTRALNRFVNWAKTNVEGASSATNYQTAALAVSEEVARLLKGGVAGEAEGQAWLHRYDPNGSPAQQQGAIDTTRHLVGARIRARRIRWNAVMGKDNADEFDAYLGDHARALFGAGSLGGDNEGEGGGGGGNTEDPANILGGAGAAAAGNPLGIKKPGSKK